MCGCTKKWRMIIAQRQQYLDRLIAGQGNGLVKVVTGGRRCGKSFLLFRLFHDHLVHAGVSEDRIIALSLDDHRNAQLRDPDTLLAYIDSRLPARGQATYVILDEVQFVRDFVGVILSLLHTPRVDVYVSGSNSQFLSKDVATEFRGRGQEIRVWPLSFAEYYQAVQGDRALAWQDYYTYGGLPQILHLDSEQSKQEYLRDILNLTYAKDIISRNHIRNAAAFSQLLRIIASATGSYVNPRRISNTFRSAANAAVADKTIKDYLTYMTDAFLVEEAMQYNVKGRRYIGTNSKYYFCDLGLRNITLNLRQQEETHIMENAIYNELRTRGHLVDVGVIDAWCNSENGTRARTHLEVDFVVNNGADRLYLQSAYRMPTEGKQAQERRPLLSIGDNFRKMIIVGDNIKRKVDAQGIVTISLLDFLLDPTSTTPLRSHASFS